MANTPFLDLPLDTRGHVTTEQTIQEGFKKLDEFAALIGPKAAALPPFTIADAGKVLTVIDDDGIAKLAFVTPA